MVDPKDVSSGDRQQVAALPVGVVDDRIEDRDPAQPRVVVDDEGHDVDVVVDIDPELERARAERPVAHDRWRHDLPAGGGRDEVGGDLAPGKGPVWEIIERALTGDGLVDGVEDGRRLGVRTADRQAAVHRVVRRGHEAPDDLHLPVTEDADDRRRIERDPGRAAGRPVS